MALYVVEREFSYVQVQELRLNQRAVADACRRLKAQGTRIRYISSSLLPSEGRIHDLFGATSAEVVREAHRSAGIPYARIVEILHVTPSFVHATVSRPRPSLQRSGSALTDTRSPKGTRHAMTEHSAPELARWLADGQRLFQVCLDTLEGSDRLHARSQTLERENEILREELARLRHKVDVLETDRSEMLAAFNDLAGHVTQVVDHILQKSEDGESTK